MSRKTLAVTVFAVALVGTTPARADKVFVATSSTCGDDLCVEAAALGRVDCDQTAADTVSCISRATTYGRVNYVGNLYLRLPGEAEFTRTMACGWFVVGGFAQTCDWETGTEKQSWEMNDLGDRIFRVDRTFGPVTYSSEDPFCLWMDLSVGSKVTATETLFGVADYETVETAAGFAEEGELACASGGTPAQT